MPSFRRSLLQIADGVGRLHARALALPVRVFTKICMLMAKVWEGNKRHISMIDNGGGGGLSRAGRPRRAGTWIIEGAGARTGSKSCELECLGSRQA